MFKIEDQPHKLNFLQILVSVLGAIIGVQNSKIFKRDFEYGPPWWVYALVGIFVVIIIVLLIIGLVKFILS